MYGESARSPTTVPIIGCGKLIQPGTPWDLGHVDGTNNILYSGIEHQACNRAAAKHKKEQRMKPSTLSLLSTSSSPTTFSKRSRNACEGRRL
jgi:hypothetical protein